MAKTGRVTVEDGVKDSYLQYAMSVITERALPDVRDGLKPVQRRIVVTMRDLGLGPRSGFSKSARIVGHCMGHYHPHGDTSIYDSLVRMARDYNLRYPIVQGQGNLGSLDGDPPAAMRYTEARSTRISSELLEDIALETVDYKPNYDGKNTEPVVLPSRFPNLLCNGAIGIAVGMACSIPPHNVGEIVDALLRIIKKPSVKTKELLKYVKGPDFPTGGIVLGSDEMKKGYCTGHGAVIVRAKAVVEKHKAKERIVITELPFMVRRDIVKASLRDLMAGDLKKSISDVRDETDRKGQRLVVDVRRGENAESLLNVLYEKTSLQSRVSMLFTVLDGGVPKVLDLKQLLVRFLSHRVDVVRRRTVCLLGKDEVRMHELEGLRIAIENLDDVIELIRSEKKTSVAGKKLMKKYGMTDVQVKVVLATRLEQLTGLEIEKVKEEHTKLRKRIKEYKEILRKKKLVLAIISKELKELKKTYGKERRTEIAGNYVRMSKRDFIPSEDVVVVATNSGYIKRMPMSTYRRQRRGGKGVTTANMKKGDFVSRIFVANTHHYLLLFTNKGMVHWLRVYDVPQMGRTSRGRALVNLVGLESDEEVTSILSVDEFDKRYVFMATRSGNVKRVTLKSFSSLRKKGIKAIGLASKDRLVGAVLTRGKQQVSLATEKGKAIRFKEKDVRSMGRGAKGVRGIRLADKDHVTGLVVVDDGELLCVTSGGYGKRTPFSNYRTQSRGGRGVYCMKCGAAKVIGTALFNDANDMVLVTKKGKVVRIPVKSVNVTAGRNTRGVRLVRLDGKDKVVSFAEVQKDEPEES